MRGIKIVCVGRVKEEFFKEGIGHYVKEIRKKYPMDILECPDEPTPDSCPESVERQIRDTEGERILNKIKTMNMLLLFVLMESIIVHRNGATG